MYVMLTSQKTEIFSVDITISYQTSIFTPLTHLAVLGW